MSDLIKQKSAEEPASTGFLAGIAAAREHREQEIILRAFEFHRNKLEIARQKNKN